MSIKTDTGWGYYSPWFDTFHWEAFTNQMEHTKRSTGLEHLNIQQLFYGTREHFVDLISDRNFEWRETFADSGRDYGRGAYFYNR